MFSKRFFISLLAIAGIALFTTGCGSSTPAGTAKDLTGTWNAPTTDPSNSLQGYTFTFNGDDTKGTLTIDTIAPPDTLKFTINYTTAEPEASQKADVKLNFPFIHLDVNGQSSGDLTAAEAPFKEFYIKFVDKNTIKINDSTTNPSTLTRTK